MPHPVNAAAPIDSARALYVGGAHKARQEKISAWRSSKRAQRRSLGQHSPAPSHGADDPPNVEPAGSRVAAAPLTSRPPAVCRSFPVRSGWPVSSRFSLHGTRGRSACAWHSARPGRLSCAISCARRFARWSSGRCSASPRRCPRGASVRRVGGRSVGAGSGVVRRRDDRAGGECVARQLRPGAAGGARRSSGRAQGRLSVVRQRPRGACYGHRREDLQRRVTWLAGTRCTLILLTMYCTAPEAVHRRSVAV